MLSARKGQGQQYFIDFTGGAIADTTIDYAVTITLKSSVQSEVTREYVVAIKFKTPPQLKEQVADITVTPKIPIRELGTNLSTAGSSIIKSFSVKTTQTANKTNLD